SCIIAFVVFFFQAEDGIRDFHVTGVQTCALPISAVPRSGDLRSEAPASTEPTPATAHAEAGRADAEAGGNGAEAGRTGVVAGRATAGAGATAGNPPNGAARTPSGLPWRVRQASLPKQLLEEEVEEEPPMRDPDEVRRAMRSFQLGTHRGRSAAGGTAHRPAEESPGGQPGGREEG